MALSLAHLSDVHLGPLPRGAAWDDFALKRLIGTLSWNFRRHQWHDPEISQALVADIKAAAPGHVAFTGDLMNISAHAEFIRALGWLRDFGDPAWISFVPGNHDDYVPVPWEHGLGHLSPYMTGDLAAPAAMFPYVRLRRNLAIIGLNSAAPQSLSKAAGTLGPRQLEILPGLLRDLKAKGYYRAVMIHHPPLPGLAPARKALSDAPALRDVLAREGAELVLHGHNHRHMLNLLDGPDGKIPIVGVPSASMRGGGHDDPAAWNLYEINRSQGSWRTRVSTRAWDHERRRMVSRSQFMLPS